MVVKALLHEGWTVEATSGPVPRQVQGRSIPASVPGCVTTDLLAAGLVPDPYLDSNESLLEWVGRTRWQYTVWFDAAAVPEGDRLDLVCEGLDTVAELSLNGTVLGNVANMHRSYRFDLRPALVEGRNHLQVVFEAPLDAAQAMSEAIGPRHWSGPHPFNAIRKMACNYGWDWGPDLPTAGVWRPVSLERWSVAHVASVRPLVRVGLTGAKPAAADAPWADHTSPRKADAVVALHVDIERAATSDVALILSATVGTFSATCAVEPGQTEAVLEVAVPSAELWWPAGYGPQPLYDVEVVLERRPEPGAHEPGQEGSLDRWSGRVGVRTVELDTTRDETGTRLGFVVNGRALLVRGANWIPDDCFPSRVGRERYRRRLCDARDANINLLRVWGGGIYENEDFYDIADELGLMVWQDFMLACAAYAEEEPLRSEIEAEAREVVNRLSRHASVAVWSGANENLMMQEEFNWPETWGAGYYFELFPSIVAAVDPTRPYMAGSPCSFGADAPANDTRHGSTHVWDVWNRLDYPSYRDYQPQFVAEFGFVGPPTWSTLTRAISDRPLTVGSPSLLVHQKAVDGPEKLARWLAAHFPEPRSPEDWHWGTSLVQARAIALAVEYWRSLTPRCRGTIVWQLNDCWPVVSWAAIDGDGQRKPLWYALRHAYADRLLTVQPTAGGLSVVAVNDSPTTWEPSLEVTRQDFTGNVVARSALAIVARPGESSAIELEGAVATAERPADEVLVVSAEGHRALWFYAEDRDLHLPAPQLSARAERAGDGYDVVIEASTLQRDLALLVDKLDQAARVDDMLLTLLPGSSVRLHVSSPSTLDEAALVGPGVLRSANQLYYPS
jgi:beta-mannosidase